MLKEMLKGNVVAVGKNYNELSGESVKLLLNLKCISNQNNFIIATKSSSLLKLFNIRKSTFDKHIQILEEQGFITIHGDISKFAHIEIVEDTFETISVDVALDMIERLNPSEIKLFCVMCNYLTNNSKTGTYNKNYVFPKDVDLIRGYYPVSKTEGLSDEDIESKDSNISKHKSALIKNGFIKKVAAYRISENRSTLGYFLRTGIDEVVDYDSFVNVQLEKSRMKLATKKSLEKQNYKNIESYICSDYDYEEIKKIIEPKVIQQVEVSTELPIENEVVSIDIINTQVKNENYVDIIKEFTVDTNDYKVEFEKLLDEEYDFLKSKKWDKYTDLYGYEVMYQVLKCGDVSNNKFTGVYDKIREQDERKKLNYLFTDRYDNFKNVIEERISWLEKEKDEKFIYETFEDEYSTQGKKIKTKDIMINIVNNHKELNCEEFRNIVENYGFNSIASILNDFIVEWEKKEESVLEQLVKYIESV